MKRTVEAASLLWLCLVCKIPRISIGCITPRAETKLTVNSNITQFEIYKGAIQAVFESGTPGILNYSPARQIRAWMAVMSSSYTSMAWYQPLALDFFGREPESNVLRRCRFSNNEEKILFEAHELETFTYSYLWTIQEFVPEWKDIIDSYGESIGANLTMCPILDNSFSCGMQSPIALARIIVEDVRKIFRYDGWNADGKMNRRTNQVEFEDWRESGILGDNTWQLCTTQWKSANEVCSPIDIELPEAVCWKPELRSVDDVFFLERYYLKHVAASGRSYFLGDEYICQAQVEYPCYDLKQEANALIKRIAALDDKDKIEIEFFDNMWDWFNIFTTAHWENNDFGTSQWEIIRGITTTTASMYEATILALHEKIRIGMTRPKSYINRAFDGIPIYSYTGPQHQTTGNLDGSEWLPYLTGKPYAEYPSHLACLCSAFSRSMRIQSGSAKMTSSLSIEKKSGSSKIETSKPGRDITLSFNEWDQISLICHQTRLNSGLHFSKSSDASEKLCKPVADKVAQVFVLLENGRVPELTVDVNQLPLKNRRCETISSSLVKSFISPIRAAASALIAVADGISTTGERLREGVSIDEDKRKRNELRGQNR